MYSHTKLFIHRPNLHALPNRTPTRIHGDPSVYKTANPTALYVTNSAYILSHMPSTGLYGYSRWNLMTTCPAVASISTTHQPRPAWDNCYSSSTSYLSHPEEEIEALADWFHAFDPCGCSYRPRCQFKSIFIHIAPIRN